MTDSLRLYSSAESNLNNSSGIEVVAFLFSPPSSVLFPGPDEMLESQPLSVLVLFDNTTIGECTNWLKV